MRLSTADRDRVTAAVTAAEATTAGEIVTIVAARSDAYHDVALHIALLGMLATIALAALHPPLLLAVHARIAGGWGGTPGIAPLLASLLLLVSLVFLAVRALLAVPRLRDGCVPGATQARRVRRRAIDLFHVGVHARTQGRTGVLLYLSLAERRAELVADSGVHAAVPPETWGDVLAALLVAVRADRPAEGMVAAVEAVGAILALHVPPTTPDIPELPDRLIRL